MNSYFKTRLCVRLFCNGCCLGLFVATCIWTKGFPNERHVTDNMSWWLTSCQYICCCHSKVFGVQKAQKRGMVESKQFLRNWTTNFQVSCLMGVRFQDQTAQLTGSCESTVSRLPYEDNQLNADKEHIGSDILLFATFQRRCNSCY